MIEFLKSYVKNKICISIWYDTDAKATFIRAEKGDEVRQQIVFDPHIVVNEVDDWAEIMLSYFDKKDKKYCPFCGEKIGE